jgi:hypothetical protein
MIGGRSLRLGVRVQENRVRAWPRRCKTANNKANNAASRATALDRLCASERDGQVLAALKDVRIHASNDDIAKSLQGNWRAEHLFALKQALGMFDFIGAQLDECDKEIEQQMQGMQKHDGDPAKSKRRGRARNAPKFDLRTQLYKLCGVDLIRIDGIDVTTALAVISETGADRTTTRNATGKACFGI